MNSHAIPSLFDSFNARFLSPETVAQTFIPPDHFWKLCRPCNSIILGPRGSGKTSLLKMLQTRALRSWKHPRAYEVVDKLGFVGVFIPADIIWSEQMAKLREAAFSVQEGDVLTESTITLHVLRAFVVAVIDEFVPESVHVEAGFRGSIKLTKERELVEQLSSIWRIDVKAPTLFGLQMAITAKLADIGFFIAEEQVPNDPGRGERMVTKRLIYPDFLSVIRPAIEAVNLISGNKDLKWALCFDELELVPTELQTRLVRYLRSTEQSIYFKLSMSPFTETTVEIAGSLTRPDEDDDFNLIPLWYAEKQESGPFSVELAKALLEGAGMGRTDPERFFGKPLLTESEDDVRDLYAPGGLRHAEIQALAKNDQSFREYLHRFGVRISQIHLLDEDTRAMTIRKVLPVVVYRNYFRRFRSQSDKDQLARSRKSFGVYTGWEGLSAICEGNPRWLKGIILNILNKLPKGCSSVAKSVQWNEIEEARHRFRSKLKTIRITDSGRDRGVLRLLDVVGEYFKDDLLSEQFKAEPTASFTLDEAAGARYASAVASALNAGALVYLPGDKNRLIMNDVVGKRFRLAYLLATEYKIPLRIGTSINLSNILSRRNNIEQQLLGLDHKN